MMMMSRSNLLISRVGSISKRTLSYSTKHYPFLKGTPRTMSDAEVKALMDLPPIQILKEHENVFPPFKSYFPREDGRMFLNDRESLLLDLAIPLISHRTGPMHVRTFTFSQGTPRTMSDAEVQALVNLPPVLILKEYEKVFPPGKPHFPREDVRTVLNDRNSYCGNLQFHFSPPESQGMRKIFKEVKPSKVAEVQAGADLALEK